MLPLYDSIPIDYETDEFKEFHEGWKIENSDEKLDATESERTRAAFLEFAYIARGADNDPRKYRDVIVPKAIGGQHSGVVDCKTTYVKASRDGLLRSIKGTLESERKDHFFKKFGIEKVHYWTENKITNELEFWFVYDVETRQYSFD